MVVKRVFQDPAAGATEIQLQLEGKQPTIQPTISSSVIPLPAPCSLLPAPRSQFPAPCSTI
ncbi:uncharacterized protein Dyak_GE27803 [Drosophila yakuba]|uniref:Uncharacterized protein n=1 Tax=Drosophila yakuba TaxID=7245 RepID=A0A0R1DXL8_DROYA|nr:uncharacterized protein Dyak_GE27803 [Drosophila yakuba]